MKNTCRSPSEATTYACIYIISLHPMNRTCNIKAPELPPSTDLVQTRQRDPGRLEDTLH